MEPKPRPLPNRPSVDLLLRWARSHSVTARAGEGQP